MPLVIYGVRGGYTHIHTHTFFCRMKVISRNQVHAGLWLACAWFENKNCYIFYITIQMIFNMHRQINNTAAMLEQQAQKVKQLYGVLLGNKMCLKL